MIFQTARLCSVLAVAVLAMRLGSNCFSQDDSEPRFGLINFGDRFGKNFAIQGDGGLGECNHGSGTEFEIADVMLHPEFRKNVELSNGQIEKVDARLEKFKKERAALYKLMISDVVQSGESISDDAFNEFDRKRKQLSENCSRDIFDILMPHQQHEFFQLIEWAKIRSGGLVASLQDKDYRDRLGINKNQVEEILKTAGKLRKETRSEIAEKEREVLSLLLDACPPDLRAVLKKNGLLDKDFEPSVDWLVLQQNLRFDVPKEIRDTQIVDGAQEDIPLTVFKEDFYFGIQYGLKPTISGNFERFNSNLTQPYFNGNPIFDLIRKPDYLERLEASENLTKKFEEAVKSLQHFYHQTYTDILIETKDQRYAEAMRAKSATKVMKETLAQLDEKQVDQLRKDLLRLRIRSYGFATVAKNTARTHSIELSKDDLKNILEAERRLEQEVFKFCSEREMANEKAILGCFEESQIQKLDLMLGSRPKTLVPYLDRQLLDFDVD